MSRPLILCRFGELFLKLGNRGRFEQQLVSNVRAAVADVPGASVENPHGRILIRVEEAALEDAATRAARVFGLVSLSIASEVEPTYEALEPAVVRAAQAAVARDPGLRRSFRMEARRSNKQFPATSQEIASHLGATVNAATGIPVDLHDPALTIGVELAQGRAFVYADHRPAPGGLPVGTSGRALLLLSGGIDSPVAAWLAAKRGLTMDGLYFHSPPFVGEKSRDKVVELARTLNRWNALRALHVVHFTEVQKTLRDAGPGELAVILYRRLMMRVADAIADRLEAQALVTGENLGQVASQTMTNMTTIEAAARRLVLRPLITHDKQETIALARRIGTYDTSVLPFEDCCSLFVPAHPATSSRTADLERIEAALDMPALVQKVAESRETVSLSR